MIGLSSVNHIGCIRPSRRPRRRCWSRVSVLLLSVRKRGRHVCLQLFHCEALKYSVESRCFTLHANLHLTLSECSHLTQRLSKQQIGKTVIFQLHRSVTRRGDIWVPWSIWMEAVFFYHFQKPFLCYWLLNAFAHTWNIKIARTFNPKIYLQTFLRVRKHTTVAERGRHANGAKRGKKMSRCQTLETRQPILSAGKQVTSPRKYVTNEATPRKTVSVFWLLSACCNVLSKLN